MYCGDETGAFVGDCGLSTCRFGYGGEDCPKLVLSSYSSTRSLKALDSETKQQQEQTLGKERQQNDVTSIFTPPSSLSSSMLSSLQNTPEIEQIIVNIQTLLSKNHLSPGDHHQWLPCHAIDLEKKGILSAHVDSVRFSGDIVSGLSLKSSAIMRLKQEQENSEKKSGKDDSSYIDLYLPPRSLYVLSGKCRYEYTHELLPTSEFLSRKMSDIDLDPIKVEREQRLSVIFRDAKKN